MYVYTFRFNAKYNTEFSCNICANLSPKLSNISSKNVIKIFQRIK